MDRRSLLLGGLAATMLGAKSAPHAPQPRRKLTEIVLEAGTSEVDLGGTIVRAWSYSGHIPGTPLRVKAGDELKVTLANRLPAETTIHWHGIAVRNKADGVPHLTQEPIAAGTDYTYDFTAPYPGTYWFHPHTGTQLDRGLYTPLVVEDPDEPLAYDLEWVVVLDDWLEADPDDILEGLRKGTAAHSPSTSGLLGGEAGNVDYPYFLANGRRRADAEVLRAKPRQRVRIRLLNAASDTVFRVALGGHRMSVCHTDGYPVRPVETDALLIGMGERYDVLVTLGDGVFPLVAMAEGKADTALALIRTGYGRTPTTTVLPAELQGRIIGYGQLAPTEAVVLQDKQPARTIRLELTGSMATYRWGFNGRSYNHLDPAKDAYEVAADERVRLDFVNATNMFHPVHLHGHTFAVGGALGPRKDTVIVLPGQSVPVFFDADNPGLWMIHCHNVYHAEAGMMTVMAYLP